MCGRYVSPREAEIERAWHIGGRSRNRVAQEAIRFNAAPTQQLPVVRVHPGLGNAVELYRWGLIPAWAKDPGIGAKMINARGETVAGKPAFRSAFRRRRCIVPMRGFYEWQRSASRKVPYYVHLLNAEIFGVAGLYEYWPGKDGAAPLETFTVITTDANELVARLHDRMPVVLAEKDFDAWLDPENEKTEALQQMLKPYPSEEMRAYPVSTRVNNVKNDGPELIEPAAEENK